MAPLSYEKLDAANSDIRLLKIRKRNDGEIRCELTKHTLTSNPKYFALSYVWGDPNITKEIIVDGHTFAATTNLIAALKVIGVASRLFWIDAICINQGDPQERSHQVHLMGAIFENAEGVVAWLGPENEGSNDATEIMKHMAEGIRTSAHGGISFLLEPAQRFLLDKLNRGSPDNPQSNASYDSFASLAIANGENICHLFTRPFWTRAWILQELVFAKVVVFLCGEHVLKYDDFVRIWIWLNSVVVERIPSTIFELDWGPFRRLLLSALSGPARTFVLRESLDRTFSSEQPHIDAWYILKYAHGLATSDPRDNIYSLLSLMRIGIDADYSKTVEALYLDVAHAMLPYVPMNEWFARLFPSTSRMPRLPTWVIDWDSRSKENWPKSSLKGELYNADGTMNDSLYQVEINGSSLLLRGTIFDKISLLAPFSDDGFLNARNGFQFDITGGHFNDEVLYSSVPPGIPRGQASLRLCIKDQDLDEKNRYAVGSSYLDLITYFFKTLTAPAATTEDTQEQSNMCFGDPGRVFELFFDENTVKPPDKGTFTKMIQGEEQGIQMLSYQMTKLARYFAEHFWNTRHFYTHKGYLGFGPRWIQQGDLVCVLQNCRVPILLRKVDDYYHFVSTCFVLGIMDGEAAEMVQRGEIVMQQLDIR